LNSFIRSGCFAVAISFLGLTGGCQYFNDSYESLTTLDQTGKSAQTIEAYLNYLKKHPTTSLAPRIYYRIARNYDSQSDYTNEISWYEKLIAEYPHSDEELHALLDLAALYHDKVKNPAKAMDYDQKAFNRYMDNMQVRDAVQDLIDVQFQAAVSQYGQKNYKGTDTVLEVIGKTFPLPFIQPDTRAKIDSLADRSRRAQALATVGADWVVLRKEEPFNKSYEQDFAVPPQDEQVMQSPDGNYLAERKRGPKGVFYLYVAKISAKSDKALFKLIKQTFGAERPSWSPDGQDLVFWQTVRKIPRLVKTNVQSGRTETLFYSDSKTLGIHPAYHPAGNKIAYIYEGRVSIVNTGDAGYKQLLKTTQKLDYTADLAWSTDGTMIRCTQKDKHGKVTDELLVLDVSAPNNP